MFARWWFILLMVSVLSLRAQEAPVITQQPASRTNQIGTDAVLSVTATGTAPLSYQWFFNETNLLTDATNSTLALTNVQPAQAGSYRAVVSNSSGSATSQLAFVTVVVPPFITQQPISLTVTQGQTASFAVGAGGDTPLTYHWSFNGLELAGETQDTLVINAAQPENAGGYQVIVSNSVGIVTSAVATLTVRTFDFGDAPPGYPSLSVDNGARHLLVPGIHLGADIDYEADAVVEAMANGDDLDGTDDEDGITFTGPLRAGQFATMTVVASTNGLLQGWIDADGDQSWAQASDLVLRDYPLITGENEVSFRIPATVSVLHSFARFRFSTSPVGYDGPAPDGEVEDYSLVLDPVVDLLVSVSDAPDPVAVGSNLTYSVVVSNRGPSTASGVILSDALPPRLQFVSAATSQGSCTNMNGSVSCFLGALGASNTINVTIVARPTLSGLITNTVSVITSEFDSNLTNNAASQVTTLVFPTRGFSNPETIFKDEILKGPFDPYPSTIQVSGLTASVHKVTVTLHNVSHTFPEDMDVLLVGPRGQTVMLMSDAGNEFHLVDVTLRFDDAASEMVPRVTQIVSGTYRPTDYTAVNETNPPPAPLPPYGPNLSVFNGTDPNGTWSLYAVDDVSEDGGAITDGWSLNITTIHPIADLVAAIQDQPDPGAAGTNLTYTITFTNKGPADATGVMLTDRLPQGFAVISVTSTIGVCTNENGLVSCQVGNLANGQGGVVTIVARPSLDGVYTNTAVLAANQLDLTPQDSRATAITAIAPVTDLGIQMAASQPALLEQLLVYTIVVTNRGPSASGKLTISDVLPEGVTFVSGEFGATGCTNSGNTVTCQFATLAAQATATATIRCRPNVLGIITNTATVSSPDFDPTASNNTAMAVSTVEPDADVVVSLQASPQPVGLGQALSYLIGISNAGPVEATQVALQNVLPSEVAFDAVSSSHGACSNSNGIITCDIGILPVGQMATVRVDVRPQVLGAISNYVSVSSTPTDPNLSNNVASVIATVIPAADVALAVDEFPDPVWNGERLRYLITVSNAGPSTASGVVVRDRLPIAAGVLSALASQGGCTNASGVITCGLGNIASGQTATVTLILQPLGAGIRTNQASVTANELDPNPANNQREDTTTIIVPIAAASTTNAIVIPELGASVPYPSTIFVSGVTAAVREVRVSLISLRHGFPDDLDILLVGPNGRAALIMSDAGGDFTLTGETVTFLDGSLDPLPDSTRISTGRYRPMDYTEPDDIDAFPPPAPPGPYGTNLSVFAGIDPNGPWSLYITDDFRKDSGSVANGWRVDLTTSHPIADLAVSTPDLPEFVAVGSNGLYTIVVTNRGPAPATQVRLTNEVPAALGLQLATASQGSCTVTGGVVTCDLGTIPARSNALVQISIRPSSAVAVTNPMTALATEVDLDLLNNATQAVVQIQEPPVIVVQPQNQVMTNAGTVAFTVTAAGAEPLLYQWLRNGVALTDATNSSLVLSNITAADEAPYRVRIQNRVGAVLSDAATLIVSGLPLISDILDQTVGEDTTSSSIPFTVGDEESPAETLQLRGFSSAANIINPSGIVFGGAGSNRTVMLRPLSNAVGTVVVTIEVIDQHGASKSDQFLLSIQPANDPPFINFIASQSTPEDTPKEIPFTSGDIDNPVEVPAITYTSSNPGLVPDSNIMLGGTGNARTLTVSPVADQFGVTVITLTASDESGATFRRAFSLTVERVNDSPTLDALPPLTIDEDADPQSVALTGISSGATNEVQSLSITARSSDPAIIPHPTVDYVSPNATGTLLFASYTNAHGTVTISVTVSDAQAGTLTQTLEVEVRPVDDPPTIFDIQNQSVFEDTPFAIPFVVGHADGSNALADLVLSVTSDNSNLISASNIVFAGTDVNRSLQLLPVTDQFGVATITVTATDTNGASASDFFQLTVVPVNDPPSLGALANITMAEDSSPRTVNLAGIAAGPNNESGQALIVTSTSSNPALVPNPVVSYNSPDSTGTLTIQPSSNATGEVVISVTVNDGQSEITRQFTVTVSPSNDLPFIEPIADMSTAEDTAITVPVIIGDPDLSPFLLTLTASSGNTTLVPATNLVLNGSGSNRFITILPALNQTGDANITVRVSDGTTNASRTFRLTVTPVNDPPGMNPISNVRVFQGVGQFSVPFAGVHSGASNENQSFTVSAQSGNTALVSVDAVNYRTQHRDGTVRLSTFTGIGTANITVTVNDGGASNNLGTVTFTIFVTTAGNIPPTISNIADTTTPEDTPLGPLFFNISDFENTPAQLTVTARSSNPTLLPNQNIQLGGSGGNRTITVAPATNQTGVAVVTVAVVDGNFAETVDTFVLTVTPVNDPPFISNISAQSMVEDSRRFAVPFTITDPESPAGNLAVSAESSDTAIVSNTDLVVTGNGANRTLLITPLPDQSGTPTITIRVSDGTNETTRAFSLTVNTINDGPTLALLPDQSTIEDTPHTIDCLVADSDTPLSELTLSATSSNPALLPDDSITVTGDGAERTLLLTPATNQFGATTLTVVVRDSQGASATQTCVVVVSPVNDPPLLDQPPDIFVNQLDGGVAVPLTGIGAGPGETQVLAISAASGNPGIIANAAVDYASGSSTGTLNLIVVPGAQGTASVTVTVNDGQSENNLTMRTFSVTIQIDPPVIVTHPLGQTVGRGETVTLQVEATGTGLRYQWQRDGIDLAGEVSASLVLSPAEVSDTGNYTAVVSNGGGSVTSAPASLRVLIAPDIVQILHLGTATHITFTTAIAQSYVLEYQDVLSNGPWNPLITVTGDGNDVTIEDPAPPASRFYRVRVE